MEKTIKKIAIILFFIIIALMLAGCENKEVVPSLNSVVEEEKSNDDEEFSMGEWNEENTVYTNKFLELTFNLPDGWSHLNEEEIAAIMNIGSEYLNDSQKMAYKVSQLTSAYYLVANDENTGNTISLISESPIMELSMEYYISQLKAGIEAIEDLNYEIVEEGSTKTVAGKECTVLVVEEKDLGLIQEYYIYKKDKYFVTILGTSTTGEEAIQDMLECFE